MFKNQKELMEALIAGKKIRVRSWDKDEYIYLNDRSIIVSNEGEPFSLSMTNPIVWDVFEEPKKLEEVYQWRFRKPESHDKIWNISSLLISKDEVKNRISSDFEIQIHAGPFYV